MIEVVGYFLEFYVDDRFIGTKTQKERFRDGELGYYSREDSVAEEDIFLDRGKKIKKGTAYYTRQFPLNGRNINKQT